MSNYIWGIKKSHIANSIGFKLLPTEYHKYLLKNGSEIMMGRRKNSKGVRHCPRHKGSQCECSSKTDAPLNVADATREILQSCVQVLTQRAFSTRAGMSSQVFRKGPETSLYFPRTWWMFLPKFSNLCPSTLQKPHTLWSFTLIEACFPANVCSYVLTHSRPGTCIPTPADNTVPVSSVWPLPLAPVIKGVNSGTQSSL